MLYLKIFYKKSTEMINIFYATYTKIILQNGIILKSPKIINIFFITTYTRIIILNHINFQIYIYTQLK